MHPVSQRVSVISRVPEASTERTSIRAQKIQEGQHQHQRQFSSQIGV